MEFQKVKKSFPTTENRTKVIAEGDFLEKGGGEYEKIFSFYGGGII